MLIAQETFDDLFQSERDFLCHDKNILLTVFLKNLYNYVRRTFQERDPHN